MENNVENRRCLTEERAVILEIDRTFKIFEELLGVKTSTLLSFCLRGQYWSWSQWLRCVGIRFGVKVRKIFVKQLNLFSYWVGHVSCARLFLVLSNYCLLSVQQPYKAGTIFATLQVQVKTGTGKFAQVHLVHKYLVMIET